MAASRRLRYRLKANPLSVFNQGLLDQSLLDLLDQPLSTGFIVKRRSHPTYVHSPLLDPALHQALGDLQVSRLAPLVLTQVLKERLALTRPLDCTTMMHLALFLRTAGNHICPCLAFLFTRQRDGSTREAAG